MSLIKSAICSKIAGETDGFLDELVSFQGKLSSTLETIKEFIKNLSFSPSEIIDGMCNNLLLNSSLLLPNLNEFDEIADIIASCNFLTNHETLKYPSALSRSLYNNASSILRTTISDFTSGMPEFQASDYIRLHKEGIEGLGISDYLSKLNSALGCLSSLCGYTIASRLSVLNSFLDVVYIRNDTGAFDTDAFLNSIEGLNPVNVENIKKTVNTVDIIYNDLSNKITQSSLYLKESSQVIL